MFIVKSYLMRCHEEGKCVDWFTITVPDVVFDSQFFFLEVLTQCFLLGEQEKGMGLHLRVHWSGLCLYFELYYFEAILTFVVESVSLGEPRQKHTLVSRSFTTM